MRFVPVDEFPHHLAADAAGRPVGKRPVQAVGRREGEELDPAKPFGGGGMQRVPLTADRGAVGGILDIRTGDHLARRIIRHDDGSTDMEMRIGHMGVLCGRPRTLHQIPQDCRIRHHAFFRNVLTRDAKPPRFSLDHRVSGFDRRQEDFDLRHWPSASSHRRASGS